MLNEAMPILCFLVIVAVAICGTIASMPTGEKDFFNPTKLGLRAL